ncbi:uncharacterized protein LOC123562318 [Mercenaria mercenaria]|uniref:uncharacterized protein LOC123562318 n=1 Tax=Mercenaria mercenaria TaxID=6596 RepID=UPI00234F2B06|nr:uncharacterized protein LOC123562318 [Mercenaria mercenaria]
MSVGHSPYVYLCVCVWMISNRIFVSSVLLKPYLNGNMELQSADMNQMSGKELKPFVNLYQFLKRQTHQRIAAFRANEFIEDSSAPIHRLKETYPEKFNTEHTLYDYPRQRFDILYDVTLPTKDEGTFENKNTENVIMDTGDSDFTNDIDNTISLKTSSKIDFSEKVDKAFPVKQASLATQDEPINDIITDSVELDKDHDVKDDKTETKKPVDKRQYVDCDLSKVTLNMLVEYLRYKTLCGTRTSQIRFGLGK